MNFNVIFLNFRYYIPNCIKMSDEEGDIISGDEKEVNLKLIS